jgi:hypothetical protein
MSGLGLAIAGAVGMLAVVWFVMRRRVEVPCTIELESTHDHFHAHVHLDGVEVDPGDAVLVHGAPSRIAFGTQQQIQSHATVERASWLRRQFVKLTGGTELYELYDVGFEG